MINLKKESISWQQFAIIIMMVSLGDSVLVLFNLPAAEAGRDAWISGVIGIVLGLLAFLFFSYFISKFPNMGIFDLFKAILGKWLGGILSVFFLFYVFLSIVVLIQELGDTMTTQVIPGSSTFMLNALFLLVVALAVRKGLEPIARSAEIFFPWVIGLFLFFSLGLLKEIQIDYLFPLIENGWKPIFRGAIPFTAFPFLELIPLLFIVPMVKEQKSVKKSFIVGGVLSGVILLAIMLLSILILGPNISGRHFYTSYTLAKKVSIGDFIERIDVVIGIIWILTNYYKTTLYFYVFYKSLSQWFHLQRSEGISFSLAIWVFNTTYILSPNVIYYQEIVANLWPFFDMTLSLFIPMVVLLAAAMRKIIFKSVPPQSS